MPKIVILVTEQTENDEQSVCRKSARGGLAVLEQSLGVAMGRCRNATLLASEDADYTITADAVVIEVDESTHTASFNI